MLITDLIQVHRCDLSLLWHNLRNVEHSKKMLKITVLGDTIVLEKMWIWSWYISQLANAWRYGDCWFLNRVKCWPWFYIFTDGKSVSFWWQEEQVWVCCLLWNLLRLVESDIAHFLRCIWYLKCFISLCLHHTWCTYFSRIPAYM
jgi:hypothetical protein